MVAPMTPYGYPPEYYHCLLDEQPYYLAPARLYGRDVEDPLTVNPLCWFSWHGPLPPEKAVRTLAAEYLLPSEWMVWVDDPGPRSLWPYWIGSEYYNYMYEFVPGYPPSNELPAHVKWVLTRAGVLVRPDYVERRRREWLDIAWHAAEAFERGYVSVTDLIPVFQLGALRRYYRHHTRTGSFPLGDDQVHRRYYAHNEPASRFLHFQLVNAVSDIARRLVQASYSYFVAYESGSVLDKHIDRDQCEYTLTFCLDASPEPEAQSLWPIQLDIPDGALRVWQYLGDGLLFRGRYLPHYRDVLPEGYTSTSLLLHYVDEGFSGTLW
jgi:hypothetical protein